ncbi:ABC transporter permease [Tistrella bauzanensis]|uniref:ABC transporter permease n=1 Tax=Tistrella arctica TaxID=3133430 RepID=A0ABU9YSI0_9PROT
MARYLLRRGGQAVVLLLLVSVIGFGILHLAPGGPLSQFVLSSNMAQEDIDRVTRQLGLDRPFLLQYADWLARMVVGDWGRSYRDGLPVLVKIGGHVQPTLEIMLASTAIAALIGCAIGIRAAIRRHSAMDVLSSAGAMVALSIPTFWFALMAIYVFSIELGWLPSGNRTTIGDGSLGDVLHHMVAPVMVLALVETAVWAQFMRASMLDTLGQDYIRTARAKGVPGRGVIWSHALRNALLPMITLVGLQVPTLLGGALVTETVFSWPGMGRLFLDSLEYRDYPVVMGILMLSAVMVMAGSLIADLLYAVADPRLRMD